MTATSSFSVADDVWPPGFRFHPTDEELVLYYLKRKICHKRLKLDAIAEVDVYKADPDELPGLSKLKTGDRQWFFFSPRDRKYPNGGRSNRATRHGYWKATGKDRPISCNSRSVGIKKTLVFYKGRAPSGERTDWVMHEYTLDEEELKRCPAKDYYVLYKVYKKSGPGPKNGEQYGAPFREEDWADDDKEIVCVEKEFEQVAPLQQISPQDSLDKPTTNCQAESHISLDEFMNQIDNDPLFEPISEENAINFPPREQLNGVQPGFNPTRSSSSLIQGTSGVTFANNMSRQSSRDSEENFLEDFLELDDLLGTKSTNQKNEKPVDNLRIEDYVGLCELDLFQDVSTILPDVDTNFGSQISHQIPQSCPNNLENGVLDQVSNPYFNNYSTELAQPFSQPFNNSLGSEMVNQFNYQLPHNPDVTSQLWMHNESSYMSTPTEPNQGSVIPQPSGVLYAGVNQNQYENQNQNELAQGNNDGGGSWFSSTLWSFVDTIPTTPASAAESTALVNKAFERLSSFGRRGDSIKVSKINVSNSNAGNSNAICQKSRSNRYNRGFLLFSVIGVLFAILWVFAGKFVSVLGRCLS